MNIKAVLLAAGFGSRLKPLTDIWPKCLMPINGIPLLEIWIDNLHKIGINEILINTHYLSNDVFSFLQKPKYKQLIKISYEKELLGSAGTVRENSEYLNDSTILLIHSDNFCTADLKSFYNAHLNKPKKCLITMMTFETKNPESCGIIETDNNNILTNFHEKSTNPPGFIANAAVYLIDKEVIDFINNNEEITDFTNQVIPHFLSRIYTWHNFNEHIDIGTIDALQEAQRYKEFLINIDYQNDDWDKAFKHNTIHEKIT